MEAEAVIACTATMTAKEMKRFESLCSCYCKRKLSRAQNDWLKDNASRYEARLALRSQRPASSL
jgi:hypothetical protein